MRRNNRMDRQTELERRADDRAAQTKMMATQEQQNTLLSEIKVDVGGIKSEFGRALERIIVVEQSVKSAHLRIDELTSGKRSSLD